MYYLLILFVVLLKSTTQIHKIIVYLYLLLIQNEMFVTIHLLTVCKSRYHNNSVWFVYFILFNLYVFLCFFVYNFSKHPEVVF